MLLISARRQPEADNRVTLSAVFAHSNLGPTVKSRLEGQSFNLLSADELNVDSILGCTINNDDNSAFVALFCVSSALCTLPSILQHRACIHYSSVIQKDAAASPCPRSQLIDDDSGVQTQV